MRIASTCIALLAAAALTACGPSESSTQPEATTGTRQAEPDQSESPTPDGTEAEPADLSDHTLTFTFTDSSVPPENHRSFTLTLENGIATVVVDSYGDTLETRALPVDEDAIKALFDLYRNGGLEEAFTAEDPDPGCVGGTTVTLNLSDGQTSDETRIYRCQGNDEESEQLRQAMAPIISHFDIEALTDGRYTNRS